MRKGVRYGKLVRPDSRGVYLLTSVVEIGAKEEIPMEQNIRMGRMELCFLEGSLVSVQLASA